MNELELTMSGGYTYPTADNRNLGRWYFSFELKRRDEYKKVPFLHFPEIHEESLCL